MRARWLSVLLLVAACAGPAQRPQIPADLAAKLEFEGAKSFTREQLLGAIESDVTDLERRSSKRSVVDDAAYTLEQFYAERGFADARVTYTVQENGERFERARFTIVEGTRTVIERVDFKGVSRVPRSVLLTSAGWEHVGTASQPVWYVESAVRGAAERVQHAYAERGFAQARVREPQVQFSDNRLHAGITFEVEEGVQYFVRARPTLKGGVANVEGPLTFDAELGQPYTVDLAALWRLRIAGAYAAAGYPDARVSPAAAELEHEEGSAPGVAALTFTIEPGPRVVIGAIKVTGNAHTRERTVKSELALKPGDFWDSRKEQTSFRKLYRTGLFSRVDLRLEPDSGEVRTLVVQVDEAPSTEYYLEPGYGSYERARLLVGWREKNLFGYGKNLEVEGLVAELTQKAVVRLISPHIFDSDYDGNVSLTSEHRVEPSFVKDEQGFGLGAAREISRTQRLSAEYRFRRSKVSNADLTDPDAIAALQDVDISSIQVSPTWDTRDNVLGPTRGHLLKLFLEVASSALGSELAFLRGGFTLSGFVPLGSSAVLAASARTGIIAPTESTNDIPLQERYFNGGENTVRSFKEDQLGPKDSVGNPLGGEAYDVMSVELRQRLIGNLEGALFYDGGNVVDQYQDWYKFGGFRHALGLGLRYRLPIGPVRLDWGWNPDPHSGEDTAVLHLSVGMAF
jgi:outer membrane protein assembly complex protein YaeT